MFFEMALNALDETEKQFVMQMRKNCIEMSINSKWDRINPLLMVEYGQRRGFSKYIRSLFEPGTPKKKSAKCVIDVSLWLPR